MVESGTSIFAVFEEDTVRFHTFSSNSIGPMFSESKAWVLCFLAVIRAGVEVLAGTRLT